MSEETDRAPEFWEEQEARERFDLTRQILRWSAVFAALIAGLLFALWWSSSAIHFSATRVSQSTEPTYKLYGVVRDSATRAPVPWVRVFDDPEGQPPRFETLGDHAGNFELITVAEPHKVHFVALGYEPAVIAVGRRWYTWMPKGEERIELSLRAER